MESLDAKLTAIDNKYAARFKLIERIKLSGSLLFTGLALTTLVTAKYISEAVGKSSKPSVVERHEKLEGELSNLTSLRNKGSEYFIALSRANVPSYVTRPNSLTIPVLDYLSGRIDQVNSDLAELKTANAAEIGNYYASNNKAKLIIRTSAFGGLCLGLSFLVGAHLATEHNERKKVKERRVLTRHSLVY